MARQGRRSIAITLLALSVIILFLGYGVEGRTREEVHALAFTWKPTQSPTTRPTASSSISPTVHPSYAPTRGPTRGPTRAPSPYPTASPLSPGNGVETDIGIMFLEIALPVLAGTALIIAFFFNGYPYFFSSSPSQGVQPTAGPAPIMRDMELASTVSAGPPSNPLTPSAPVGQVVQVLPLQGQATEVVPSAPLAQDVIVGVPVISPLAHTNVV